MKIKKSKMLLATIILTIIQLTLSALSIIAISFNLFGINEVMEYWVNELYSGQMEFSGFLTSYYFETALVILVNFLSVKFYIKGYKYSVFSSQYGKMMIMNAISQLLFSSFLPGIFALITAIMMMNKKPAVKPVNVSQDGEFYINEVKFEAMSQAINRLKELKDNGAISEEEYYDNLNKILES